MRSCLGLAFTRAIAAATLLAAGTLFAQPQPQRIVDRTRPNFLVVLCDDLGYGDLACYGHPHIKTPHLDQLAQEGVRFTHCYAAAPVCSSSRVGLLTGRTPARVGVYDWIPAGGVMHLPRSEITIAQQLAAAGYQTCHVGKWHCNGKFNSEQQPQPIDHGFSWWFSTQNNAAHLNPVNFVRNGQRVGPLQGYSCQLVVDEAIAWLEQARRDDQPFFQLVCFHEPHERIESPPDLIASYAGAEQSGQAEYYASVSNIDAAVGRLTAAVNRLGLTQSTLVFFTSDNGPETLQRYPNAMRSHGSAGPLRGMKLHLYEGGIRVPGIIRYPGAARRATVVAEPICALDLLPTFCAMARVEPPADRVLDGADARNALRGLPVRRTRPLFWSYLRAIGGPTAAMRVGDHMILGASDQAQASPGGLLLAGDGGELQSANLASFELYDLTSDIGQHRDLAQEQPELAARLAEQLRHRHQEVAEAGPRWSTE